LFIVINGQVSGPYAIFSSSVHFMGYAPTLLCANASERGWLEKEQHVGKLMESKAKEQQREKDLAELFFSIN
jgi:hypothetical protein